MRVQVDPRYEHTPEEEVVRHHDRAPAVDVVQSHPDDAGPQHGRPLAAEPLQESHGDSPIQWLLEQWGQDAPVQDTQPQPLDVMNSNRLQGKLRQPQAEEVNRAEPKTDGHG